MKEEDLVKKLRYLPETGELVWNNHELNRKHMWGKVAGYRQKNGYVYVFLDKKPRRAHKIAWFLHYGEWPKGYLDHINGVKYDNRIVNLRICDNQQNQYNQKPHKDKLVPYKGVSYHKGNKKYRATIKALDKRKHLGYFNTPEEARDSYNSAALELHKEFIYKGL